LAGGAVVVAVLLTERMWPPAAAAAVPRDPDVLAAFDELAISVDAISNRLLNAAQRTSLVTRLKSAEKSYVDGDICSSRTVMNAVLDEAHGYRQGGRVAIAEDIYNRSRSLRDQMLDVFVRDPKLVRPPCYDDALRRPPQVILQASDNAHVTARVTLGTARLATVQAGNETWTELGVPGLESTIGEPGMPRLPSWQAMLAIPRGATPVLRHGAIAIRETIELNAYPYQPQPADEAAAAQTPPPDPFKDKPFVKNQRAYAIDAFDPPAPCAVRFLGPMRDLHIVQVQCDSAQYNPVTDELRLYDWFEFDLRFEGGSGAFVTSQSLNPFERFSDLATNAVLNGGTARQYVQTVNAAAFRCTGEELLILGAASFRAAADDLANWKRAKGIATTVIDVGVNTPFDTGTKINRLIENRYDTCLTRPSYVLLVGDSEHVPPARTNYHTSQEPDSTTGSDWDYATHPVGPFPEGFLPYFAVGRLPVDSSFSAQLVVDKIVRYESDPPFVNFASGGPFYTTAAIASYFQCCRSDYPSPAGGMLSLTGRDMRDYVEASEGVRITLMNAGHAVQRVYTTDTELADGQVLNPVPRRFYDGGSLPADLAPASGFPWNGSAVDIINAFNTGRFLVIHRDHGKSDRWWRPRFTTDHVSSLINTRLLPVVYSIDCKSAYWDTETDDAGETGESLMEQLLTGPAGMVGGIGANRNTPSRPNSALLRGLIDATWPGMAAEFGGAVPVRRLGDILNHGKLYLATQVGLALPGRDVTEQNYIDEVILYHVLGDPTLEMWTGNPYLLPLTASFEFTQQQDGLVIAYATEGAEITALQVLSGGSTRALARGTVRDGIARLPFIVSVAGPIDPGSLMLSASLPNAVSVPLRMSTSTPQQ
jgi:hypothetical protein